MSIKETFKDLRELLTHITTDLEKAENGNKAAAQRVRTGTVKLEKKAKLFRKESIAFEKKNKGVKKPSKSAGAKKTTATKGASKNKPTSKAKTATVKAKAKSASTNYRARA